MVNSVLKTVGRISFYVKKEVTYVLYFTLKMTQVFRGLLDF